MNFRYNSSMRAILKFFTIPSLFICLHTFSVFAFMPPGNLLRMNTMNTMNGCQNFSQCAVLENYYGRPIGNPSPYYLYPALPSMGFFPAERYFSPHSPSPYYHPGFDNYCIHCNGQQYLPTNPSRAPSMFPNVFQHQGGGVS